MRSDCTGDVLPLLRAVARGGQTHPTVGTICFQEARVHISVHDLVFFFDLFMLMLSEQSVMCHDSMLYLI